MICSMQNAKLLHTKGVCAAHGIRDLNFCKKGMFESGTQSITNGFSIDSSGVVLQKQHFSRGFFLDGDRTAVSISGLRTKLKTRFLLRQFKFHNLHKRFALKNIPCRCSSDTKALARDKTWIRC
jgi:hypothetical protein